MLIPPDIAGDASDQFQAVFIKVEAKKESRMGER